MVWSLWLESVRAYRSLLSCLTVLSLPLCSFIMVYQLICCLKRNHLKGDGTPTEQKSRRGYYVRKNRTPTEIKAAKELESWKNSISDISTCDIINPPSYDCGMGDAGIEAKIRHRTLNWYPELRLQPRSITRKNYAKFDRSLITKHPPHEGVASALTPQAMQERKAKYKDKHITWESDCPVFIVYGYDVCRGELDYDENTMDDLSYREAEEIEKSVDKALLPRTPNKENSKSSSAKKN
ncbi:hypothetical protein RB195_008738 [Necator americanus]|uniref:Uncharacterized protein n=1 Tax=Necator americanus TaxID=51031 RepID=A0ABR1CQ18_NECAM